MLVYPSMFGGIYVNSKLKTSFQVVLLKIHVWLQRGNYEQKVIYPPNMLCVYFLELHWFLPVKSTLFRIGGGLVMSQGLDLGGKELYLETRGIHQQSIKQDPQLAE